MGFIGSLRVYFPHSQSGCGYSYNTAAATGAFDYNQYFTGGYNYSICPYGWHLPHSTATNEFAELNVAMATASAPYSSTDYENWYTTGAFSSTLVGYYDSTTRAYMLTGSAQYLRKAYFIPAVVSGYSSVEGFVTTSTSINTAFIQDNLRTSLMPIRCILG